MIAPPSNEAGKESCEGLCSSCADKGSCDDPRARQKETVDRMTRIKHKIVIGSGKGGVGKSTVTVNLAAALQSRGFKVGILDADITGPNIPKLLGIEDQKMMAGPVGLDPADAAGIKVVSMALLLKSNDVRVPQFHAVLRLSLEELNILLRFVFQQLHQYQLYTLQ